MERIIWSVDPFEKRSEPGAHVIQVLQGLSSRGAWVEPVYVLSPNEYHMDLEFSASWIKEAGATAERVLRQYLKDVKIPGLAEPRVIVERRPTLKRAIHALTAHAKLEKADLIVAGTHGRRALSRFFIGSFAETLVLYSKIPVLVVGPYYQGMRSRVEVEEVEKNQRILFSTDFGAASYPTFKKVVALAKARDAKVTLYHCLFHPIEPALQFSAYLLGGGALAFPDLITREEERKRKLAIRYVAFAKRHGIEVEIRMETGNGSTAQAIVDRAQAEKADLIAMAAESGAVAAALIGSVTRQVVRTAPCPVWVMRAS